MYIYIYMYIYVYIHIYIYIARLFPHDISYNPEPSHRFCGSTTQEAPTLSKAMLDPDVRRCIWVERVERVERRWTLIGCGVEYSPFSFFFRALTVVSIVFHGFSCG